MFNFQLFIAAVVTAAHIRSVLSFQPGSDYDAYKTTNLYNCTGKNPASNVTALNAIDTLPQIEPSSGHGWEQWSLFLHGTFPMILRWNQGNPSAPEPSPAHFDILVGDVNGTTVQGTVVGNLSYTDTEHVKQIAIGDNSLTWDSDALWYNVSVSIDGYQLELDSFSYVFTLCLYRLELVTCVIEQHLMGSIRMWDSTTDYSTSPVPGSVRCRCFVVMCK